MSRDAAELSQRLDAIGEDLADLALDLLRQAIGEGATGRPDAEKRVTQARRAVEKAARLLDQVAQSDAES